MAQTVSRAERAPAATVHHNAAGLLTTRTSGDQSLTRYYDPLGRVSSTSLAANSATQMTEGYAYYGMDDVHTRTTTLDGQSHAFTYSYDKRHQLLTASSDDGYSGTFTYGHAGRLTSADVVAPTGGAPQVWPRDVTYDYGQTTDPQAVDRLLNPDQSAYASYTYDAAGNVTARTDADGTYHFVYDAENQQRRAENPDGSDELYYYTAPGQRFVALTRDASGNVTGAKMWLGPLELWYAKAGGTWGVDHEWAYASLDTPVARVGRGSADALEYSYHDAYGHLLASLDASDNFTAGFVYGPFGSIVDQVGNATGTHLRRFNGKEYDAESQLSYYGYRYYDPLSLSWTQSDPLYRFAPDLAYDQPRRLNLYAFSLENPLRYYDPDGRGTHITAGEESAEGIVRSGALKALCKRNGAAWCARIKKEAAAYNEALLAQSVEQSKPWVRRHPWKTIGIGAAAGATLGVGFWLFSSGVVAGLAATTYTTVGSCAATAAATCAASGGPDEVPTLSDALQGLGKMDASVIQRAVDLAKEGDGSFSDALSALSRATTEVVGPSAKVHLIGEFAGHPIFGSAISRVGIVASEGGTLLVRAPADEAVKVLGFFR